MTAIVDYGVGNLYSLQCSLKALGIEAEVVRDEKALASARRIILPGVGAFGDAAKKLKESGLAQPLRTLAAQGKPLLGICVGMQLLFDKSYEFGEHEGLGLVGGQVCSLAGALKQAGLSYKVPHIGWNALQLQKPSSPLLKFSKQEDYVYYVHSFYATGCEKHTVAISDYGVQVCGAVQNKNVFGTQFHPEKSGNVGLAILRAFAEVS